MKKGGTFFSRASLTRLSLGVTGPCLEKGNATTPFEKRDDVEEEARTTTRRTRMRTRTTVKRAREEESDEEGLLWRLVRGFGYLRRTSCRNERERREVLYDVNRESRRAIKFERRALARCVRDWRF